MRVGAEWVVTLPHRVRYVLAWHRDLCKAVVRVMRREVQRHLRTRARARGLDDVRGGAVESAEVNAGDRTEGGRWWHNLAL